MSIFKNGNRRIAKLTIIKLAFGCFIIVLVQTQGAIVSQDWLTYGEIKVWTFVITMLLTLSKGIEMFFDKTIAAFKNHEITDETETTTEPEIKP